MSKEQSIFVCSNCGGESLKWQGKCPFCSEWNTLREIKNSSSPVGRQKRESAEPEKLSEIKTGGYERIKSGLPELDRVLGGGIVGGSLILLGGEPGIGKSTLSMQFAKSFSEKSVLYISGEESKEQIKMRASRLGIEGENINVLCDTNIDNAINAIIKTNPSATIIDSIQAMYDENYPSTPGSIVQLRECALKLQRVAKTQNVPIILTGHVTKEGVVAGPKILEHLVDVVLYLEGERFENTRILHGVKNRFGNVDEVGIFEMKEKGLLEIKNPSEVFLEHKSPSAGSAISAAISGSRVFLVEIQSLLSKSYLSYPKRTVSGFDLKRLDLLLAVMQKNLRLPLLSYDVYVNIVGGFKIVDRVSDLAVCASIYSFFKNR